MPTSAFPTAPSVVAVSLCPAPCTSNRGARWPPDPPGLRSVRSRTAAGRLTPTPPIRFRCTCTSMAPSVVRTSRPQIGPTSRLRIPAWGPAHGFNAMVGPFYGGVHQVCVYAINAGGGVNPQLGCAKVTLPSGNPRGSLNIAQGAPGAVRVVGWMLDPDTASSTSVHVYVDGRWSGAATANVNRPDVAAAFPGYGAAHGFDFTVPVSGGGVHQVCIYGINVGQGTANPRVACATVTSPTGPPTGSFDVAQGQAGGVRIAGWSIDPDTLRQCRHVYVDGRWTAAMTANAERADVASAFPAYGALHGYDTIVPLTAGCAQGPACTPSMSDRWRANPLLGCRAVTTRSSPPIGGDRCRSAAFPGELGGPRAPRFVFSCCLQVRECLVQRRCQSDVMSPTGTYVARPPVTSRSTGRSLATTGTPHASASSAGSPKPGGGRAIPAQAAPATSACNSGLWNRPDPAPPASTSCGVGRIFSTQLREPRTRSCTFLRASRVPTNSSSVPESRARAAMTPTAVMPAPMPDRHRAASRRRGRDRFRTPRRDRQRLHMTA